jgi:polyphosphate kinase
MDGISLPTIPDLLARPDLPLIHRDLSWLQFNERVLAEARSEKNPLLERVRFLGISASNLDEFFMIRFPSLIRSIQISPPDDPSSQLRLNRIRNDILNATQIFTQRQSAILETLEAQLEPLRVHISPDTSKNGLSSIIERKIFEEEILPKLPQPEIFSYQKLNALENLQLAFIFNNQYWLKIPKTIPTCFFKWNEVTREIFSYFLDQILISHLGPRIGFQASPILLKLTRDSDFSLELADLDPESIPDRLRLGLGKREQGRPTRLQYCGKPSKKFLSQTISALKLLERQVIETPETLCLASISQLPSLTPPSLVTENQLCYPALRSRVPNPFRKPDKIFDRLDCEDLLLHHPYDSFEAFENWVRAACEDPSVIQIEQTVYRIDTISTVMEALKKAASSKKIRVLIELRARFDELNNLKVAEELKAAGVEVFFGFGKLKVHGKVALITRKTGETIRHYAHLSTGNYKASTARLYTDLAIITSHPEICSDVRYFFDRIFSGQIPQDFKQLIPAPAKLHHRLISHIEAEIQATEQGRAARIFAKVNALVDETVVQQLYRASQAGVQVDLIVRGACSLVPGVKGLSENIRVISIVDRFLEHSRIYHFGDAQVIYLSSADWMPRNFFSRLEIAFPVLDFDIYRYIHEVIIPVSLGDTEKARVLTPEGKWKRHYPSPKIKGDVSIRSQFYFEDLAVHNYENTPLWRKK